MRRAKTPTSLQKRKKKQQHKRQQQQQQQQQHHPKKQTSPPAASAATTEATPMTTRGEAASSSSSSPSSPSFSTRNHFPELKSTASPFGGGGPYANTYDYYDYDYDVASSFAEEKSGPKEMGERVDSASQSLDHFGDRSYGRPKQKKNKKSRPKLKETTMVGQVNKKNIREIRYV